MADRFEDGHSIQLSYTFAFLLTPKGYGYASTPFTRHLLHDTFYTTPFTRHLLHQRCRVKGVGVGYAVTFGYIYKDNVEV